MQLRNQEVVDFLNSGNSVLDGRLIGLGLDQVKN